MSKQRKTTRVTTTEEHHLEVDKCLLFDALNELGYDIPLSANAWMDVPGGGDWSNCRLTIGDEGNLHVTWSETRHATPRTEEL